MTHRIRRYSAALLISTVPFLTVSCDKKTPASSGGDAAALVSKALAGPAWGYAARLPKDTEAFAAFYRLEDLLNAFTNSNFVKKAMANPALVKNLNLNLVAQVTSSPDFKEGLAFAKEVAGKEVLIATGEGFTENAVRIANALAPFVMAGVQGSLPARVDPAAAGGAEPATPPQSPFEKMLANDPAAMAALVDALAVSDIPPVSIVVKAGDARARLNGLLQTALEKMPDDARKMLDTGSFTLDGKYDIQTFTFTPGRMIPQEALPAVAAKLGELAGDPAKGAALAEKLLKKTVEFSWGWVDDHLLIAVGKDHSHVKLAAPSEGVFSLPEIAPRAAQWAGKKPFAVAYRSQKVNRAISSALGSLGGTLISLAQSAGAQSPVPVEPLVADLQKLGARAKELWPSNPSASIAALWWEGGLRAESFGGGKPEAFDSSKPLTLTALAGPATVWVSGVRVNEAARDKVFAFIEEAAGTLYNTFSTSIRPGLPEDVQKNIASMEPLALPLVKSIWKSVQDFRAAMGPESAAVLNLDGTVPESLAAQMPPEMKGVKIPRILVVSDLKNPAKLTESWSGFSTVISGVVAMTQAPVNTTPVEKKEGGATLWGFQLPMDTGDLWPHTAVAGSRWFMGTSTSFTKEAAAKSPSATGPACGAYARLNFDATLNYAASLVSLLPSAPEQKQHMNDVIALARALGEIEARSGEDNGDSHCTLFIGIKDVK